MASNQDNAQGGPGQPRRQGSPGRNFLSVDPERQREVPATGVARPGGGSHSAKEAAPDQQPRSIGRAAQEPGRRQRAR